MATSWSLQRLLSEQGQCTASRQLQASARANRKAIDAEARPYGKFRRESKSLSTRTSVELTTFRTYTLSGGNIVRLELMQATLGVSLCRNQQKSDAKGGLHWWQSTDHNPRHRVSTHHYTVVHPKSCSGRQDEDACVADRRTSAPSRKSHIFLRHTFFPI